MKYELIKKHLETDNTSGLDHASVQHYFETGKVSGDLHRRITELMKEYANHR